MKRAPLIARFLAFVIDIAFLWCVAALMTGSVIAGYSLGASRISFADPVAVGLAVVLIFLFFNLFLSLFYFTYLTSGGGKTIGKDVFNIRVVRRHDEGNVGLARAFVRACAYALSTFPFLLGFFMAFLLKGKALHDVLTGTKVAREE